MSKTDSRYDRWVIRDDVGLLHNALVFRVFDDNGNIRVFQVSTACAPVVKQYKANPDHPSNLPPSVSHGDFLIVEWHVREAPTCLICVIAPVIG